MWDDLLNITFPRMVKVRQEFPATAVVNIEEAVVSQLAIPEIASSIKPGARIAILVGSRGIANIGQVVAVTVREIKKLGAYPFIVPAMGSHGGATAEGQKEVLHDLGVREESVGAPIISSMDTVELGRVPSGRVVYFDRNAAGADGIIAIARIKPHTAFRFRYESGLIKMLSIGGGKQKGADLLHADFHVDRFGPMLLENFRLICDKTPVLFGLAVVENAHEQLAKVEAIPVKAIEAREAELLKAAWNLMPRLLFDNFDVLIVEKMGKNISGDGMDPNITGRYATGLKGGPSYQRLAVLDLTIETHGNAMGIGMADVTTRRLVDKIDPLKGYMNALTSKIVMDFVKVPMTMASDKEAIAVALKSCVCVTPGQEKVVRIKSTMDLCELEVSETLLDQVEENSCLSIIRDPRPMEFDQAGKLL